MKSTHPAVADEGRRGWSLAVEAATTPELIGAYCDTVLEFAERASPPWRKLCVQRLGIYCAT